jgi:murein DD-endopeptidase MepM/ murein hydrolase activator NlpD
MGVRSRQGGRVASLGVAAATLAGAAFLHPSVGRTYSWPLKPFDRQHPIIGFFGDPRTVFDEPLALGGLYGPGEFSFHNGVDIAARAGTAVFAVASGTVHRLSGSAIVVRSSGGRFFQYYHLREAVSEGQYVIAHQTVLGYVLAWARHLHFGEITGGRPLNPLLPGNLTPYRDRTRPRVTQILFRAPDRQPVDRFALHGRVEFVAQAYDTPPLHALRRKGFDVTPAVVRWEVTTRDRIAVPETTAVDFYRTIPRNADFWRIYARGTYENAPGIGRHRLARVPGRYLFRLTPEPFDTRSLPDGTYVLRVTAEDERGNRGTRSESFVVRN